jgi:hypothetical protein
MASAIGLRLHGIEGAFLSVTVRCRACGALHEMGHCSPIEFAFCGPACEKRFNKVVDMLSTGAPLDMVGAKPGDRVYEQAMKEISARRVRDFTQQRDWLERQYLETRPRRLEPVAKRYFSF